MSLLGRRIEPAYIAGVDVGGTNIRVTIANKDGILIKLEDKTNTTDSPARNRTIPHQIANMITYAWLNIPPSEKSNPGVTVRKAVGAAVGISTCSPFKKKDGLLYVVSPNLCGGLAQDRPNKPKNIWTEIPLEAELKKSYDNLKIGNDCVTAVVAEKLFGNGKGVDNLVYVTWSTGIGAGAYVDGHLLSGNNGNSPHGGHIFIAEDGPQCGCGNHGDLESLTSGVSIARDYGVKPDKTHKVFEAYKKDPKAKKIIDRAARNFARGLASMNAMFDTKRFVIGGSVMKHNSKLLLPLVKKEFYSSFPALSEDVEIIETGLGDYLGDMAALSLVMPEEWIKEWQRTEPWKKKIEVLKYDR